MIALIKRLLSAKPAKLTIPEALIQYKAAQMSNDPEVRKAASDELDRAYRAERAGGAT